MAQFKLRDYQTDIITAIRTSLSNGNKRPCVQAPTGSGKTVIAASIVNMAMDKGKKVLFCVPSISLIDQTVKRFEENGIWDVGVIQAFHERTDYRMPVQVCSVQTLARRSIPECDLVIIDEAHVMFKFYQDAFANVWSNVPVIGLTATPWQKGMGKLYDDLIIGQTTQGLIDLGHLSDFKVFAPSHPDLDGVKTIAGDYDLKGLGEAMDKAPLVADIVSTWMERGENRQTLCFAVNRAHAKNIQTQFEKAGVKTAYMDAYTDLAERQEIADQFANGDIQIVCNVGVLTTGVDWDVRCIILARPTKSEILYTQIIGRGLRTADGKDHCLILDHSDTTLRLGFVTSIHHDTLDDGKTKKKAEVKKREYLPKECAKCNFLKPPKTRKCPVCGFEAVAVSDVDHIDGELAELGRDGSQKLISYTQEQKQQFYSELISYARAKGFKSGWAYWTYKDKFKVGPSNKFHDRPLTPSSSTMAWITHRNIARAKQRSKDENRSASHR